MRTHALHIALAALVIPFAAFACGGTSDGSTDESDESLSSDDPQEAAELDAELAKDDVDVENEVAQELADDDAAEDAFEASGGSDVLPDENESGLAFANGTGTKTGGKTAPKCKKEIRVVMAVGVPTTLLRAKTNGCWTVEIADDSAHRRCWYERSIANKSGATWIYDDTNPAHGNYASEAAYVHACDNAGGRGYEYMANRGGWRFVSATHLDAYFAELYSDSNPRNIDDLWHQRFAYKQNADVKKHRKHTFPMIAIGEINQRASLAHQTLATCKTVRNGGYFGLYNPFWHPTDSQHLGQTDYRLRRLANALNQCTAPKPVKKK